MIPSPGDERREVLLPSLVTVHGHSVHGVHTTRDDQSVRFGDSTGKGASNKVKVTNE